MAASLIVSTGTVANGPGRAQQSRLVYAVNTALWWCFYRISSDTTKLFATYSADLVTWSAPTNPSLTLAHASSGKWDMGLGYASIAAHDVVHISIFTAGVGGLDYWSHVRATLAGTTITWGTEAVLQSFTASGNALSAMSAIASDGSVFDYVPVNASPAHSGDFTLAQATHTDAGTSWTAGFNALTDITDASTFFNSGTILPYAAGGKVMALVGDGGATIGSAFYSVWGGASWAPTGNSGIFLTEGSYSPEDWGVCRRTDTDIHAIRRNNSTSTFTHVRWNGTSWSAGQTMPNSTCKAGAGLALATDGTNAWAFLIDSAAGNAVKYCKWTAATPAWAGSWTTLDSSSQVRSALTAVYAATPQAIALSWAQTNGSNFDMMVEALSLAPPATLGRRTLQARAGSRTARSDW